MQVQIGKAEGWLGRRGAACWSGAEFFVLLQDVGIGHAGDVIADHARQGLGDGLFAIVAGEGGRIAHPVGKQVGDDALGVDLFRLEVRTVIKVAVKELLGLAALLVNFGGKSGEALGMGAHGVEGGDAGVADATRGVGDQVGDQAVEHALEGLIEFQFFLDGGEGAFGVTIKEFEYGNGGANLGEREDVGFVAVVEVGGVVGNFVSQVDELGFERWALIKQVLGELGIIGGAVVAGVLDDAFAHLESQVQAGEGGIALLEILDDAQSVEVMVEEVAVRAHSGVESFFAGVAEGGMADVVHQGESFDQVNIEIKLRGDGAGNLRHFDGVSQAIAEVVGKAAGEDLSFGFQTAKGAGVDDAVAVALEGIAVGMRRLGVAASAGIFHTHSVGGQHVGISSQSGRK